MDNRVRKQPLAAVVLAAHTLSERQQVPTLMVRLARLAKAVRVATVQAVLAAAAAVVAGTAAAAAGLARQQFATAAAAAQDMFIPLLLLVAILRDVCSTATTTLPMPGPSTVLSPSNPLRVVPKQATKVTAMPE